MRQKIVWVLVSCLVIAALVLASCAPAAQPTKPPTQTQPTSTAPASPTAKAPPTPTAAPAPASDKPQYGGTLTITYPEVVNYDPYRYEIYSHRTTSFVFEKLIMGDWGVDRKLWAFPDEVGYAPLKYMRGGLAESWEVNDLLTIIVHLRKGVRFQNVPPVNGREFTADDVVWNLDRDRKDPFMDTAYLKLIDTVTKIDKYTVEIKVKPPKQLGLTVNLLDTSSVFYIAPETIGKSGEIENWRNIIGTGPYLMKDWVSGSSITLEKNPDYWGYDELNPQNRLPYADRVNILIISDPSTWLAGLRTGKVDQNLKLDWKTADSLKKTSPQLLFQTTPIGSAYILAWRWNNKPFDDLRVRKAMSMAIDRDAISKSFYNGWAKSYCSPLKESYGELFTPQDKLPDSVKELLSYNPTKAKQLLAEAGFPNGFKTVLDITPTRQAELFQVVQQDLSKIGIQAELHNYEWATYNSMMGGKKFQQLFTMWISTPSDPMRWFQRAADLKDLNNQASWNDPVYNEMYAKVAQTLDQAQSDKLLKELNYYLLEQVFFVSLPIEQTVTVWQPWIKGYSGEGPAGAHNAGVTFARVWIDQGLKAAKPR